MIVYIGSVFYITDSEEGGFSGRGAPLWSGEYDLCVAQTRKLPVQFCPVKISLVMKAITAHCAVPRKQKLHRCKPQATAQWCLGCFLSLFLLSTKMKNSFLLSRSVISSIFKSTCLIHVHQLSSYISIFVSALR